MITGMMLRRFSPQALFSKILITPLMFQPIFHPAPAYAAPMTGACDDYRARYDAASLRG